MARGVVAGQVVAAIWPRTGSTRSGRGSPETRGDQTPAASTTCSEAVLPLALTTPVTKPSAVSTAVTASARSVEPKRRAAARQARVRAWGSSAPPSGANTAPDAPPPITTKSTDFTRWRCGETWGYIASYGPPVHRGVSHVPERHGVRPIRRAGVARPQDHVRPSRRPDRLGDDDPVSRCHRLSDLSRAARCQPEHRRQGPRHDQGSAGRHLTTRGPSLTQR